LTPPLWDSITPAAVIAAAEKLPLASRLTIAFAVLALVASIGHRNDRNQWFEGHVTVKVPPEAWRDAWEAPK
jgi:hypothetical protein